MKVAILGGGAGAMTAAYWLTNPPELGGPAEPMEVSVYQIGWRLGGKGASGRNQQAANRIEEHGLHIWMGFYANAFRMMQQVYAELDRPEGAALRTWQEAFKPQNVITLMQAPLDGAPGFTPAWMFPTPPLPGVPGEQTGFPTPAGYIGTLVSAVQEHIQKLIDGDTHDSCPPHEWSPEAARALDDVHKKLTDALAKAPPPHKRGHSTPEPIIDALLEVALETAQWAIHKALDITSNCLGVYRMLILGDVAIATALGILRDLMGKPWTAIDDQEWVQWMLQNGLSPRNQDCPITRGLYDLVFAYPNGVVGSNNGNLAAGTASCAWLRIVFEYYGSIFWKMQAGMGDAIFAPLYEVLRRRGVTFKFFHCLQEVVPSENNDQIDQLRFGVQATTWAPEYHPLFEVNRLPCWPSEPFYDQLREADHLRANQIDLESPAAPFVGEHVLDRNNGDFDLVVFGLSVASVPATCSALVQNNQSWSDMVANVQTVNTQGIQFWLRRNVADLGWTPALDGTCRGERGVVGAFVEPVDTWADMSQLIPREQWAVPMNNISYFCGVLPNDGTLEMVKQYARTLLNENIGMLWSEAAPGGKFQYDLLSVNVPDGTFTSDERFNRQYFRANTEGSERYVLSVAGSTRYRLDPANTGYTNLVLAGDWVLNGLAIGCVESAVLGGMKGVQKFCPGMQIVE